MSNNLYKLTTTDNAVFYVVSADPTTAENLVNFWISNKGWRSQKVTTIELVAEPDEYTKVKILLTAVLPEDRNE